VVVVVVVMIRLQVWRKMLRRTADHGFSGDNTGNAKRINTGVQTLH